MNYVIEFSKQPCEEVGSVSVSVSVSISIIPVLAQIGRGGGELEAQRGRASCPATHSY